MKLYAHIIRNRHSDRGAEVVRYLGPLKNISDSASYDDIREALQDQFGLKAHATLKRDRTTSLATYVGARFDAGAIANCAQYPN